MRQRQHDTNGSCSVSLPYMVMAEVAVARVRLSPGARASLVVTDRKRGALQLATVRRAVYGCMVVVR